MLDIKMFHQSKPQQTTYYSHNQAVLTVDAHSYLGEVRILCYDPGHYVSIGKFCSVANDTEFTLVTDHAMHLNTTFPLQVIWPEMETYCADVKARLQQGTARPVNIRIGHDVWIGRAANILAGVTIGHGAVIGTGCVVSKDIPPYAVAVGNPCKVIKYRFEAERIDMLLEMQWWNWPLAALKTVIHHLLSDRTEDLYAYYLANKPQLDIARTA
jgi:acetyltransferase-like isoleucine patch superfamily enzyme